VLFKHALNFDVAS
jgi:nucleoside diphosphate kinase